MFRLASSLALATALLGGAPLPAQEKKLTIRWFGQSFFQVTTSSGTRIVFDPHAIEQYPRQMVPADLVLISHPHLDHATLNYIPNRDKAKVIAGIGGTARRQEFIAVDEKFRDCQIYNVSLFHDKDNGMLRGRNSAFVVEVDGLRICHLGDLGHELSDRQLKRIGEVDILMIPIGGIYTLNGTDARAVVEQIQPKRLILPMHYGTKAFQELLGPEEFLDGLEGVERRLDTNELTLDAAAPIPPKPRVVLLGWSSGGE